MSATCKLDVEFDVGPHGKVLGVELDGESLQEQFRTATTHITEVCEALREVQDPRVELALLRVSANVCRVVHLLRAAGPDLEASLLGDFDSCQREALGSLLGGPLSDRVWDQAAGSSGQGGLGLRSARELQFPFILGKPYTSHSVAKLARVTRVARYNLVITSL